jgi:transcriptional regulator with XRE-family HTH domain
MAETPAHPLTLGQRLRELRGEAARKAFASRLGVSESYLRYLEEDKQLPRPTTLRLWEVELKAPAGQLLWLWLCGRMPEDCATLAAAYGGEVLIEREIAREKAAKKGKR